MSNIEGNFISGEGNASVNGNSVFGVGSSNIEDNVLFGEGNASVNGNSLLFADSDIIDNYVTGDFNLSG